MSDRGRSAWRRALVAWILLAACVLAWPWAGAGTGITTTAVALLPLLLPLHGLLSGSSLTLRSAPLALVPALTVALTETLVNAAARVHMAATLALVLAAFAAILPVMRNTPRA